MDVLQVLFTSAALLLGIAGVQKLRNPHSLARALRIAHLPDRTILVRGATADRARDDVTLIYPEYAPDHGYDVTIELGAGPHLVCVYGINEGPGSNALLGCRST